MVVPLTSTVPYESLFRVAVMVYAGAGGGFCKGDSRYRGTGDFRSGFIRYLKGHGVLYLFPVTVSGYRLRDFQTSL